MLITAALTALLATGGRTQATHEYLADPLLDSVDYTSKLVPGHAHQRFALFRPAGTPPESGTPVVILVNNAGLASSDSCYGSPIGKEMTFIYSFLDAGFAVVRAALTSSDTSKIPTPCVPYPDLTQKGNGLFHPPGVALPGLALPPYSDHGKPMAEKDMVMLVQHVRYNAEAYGLDPDRIAVTGRSGGAVIAMWTAAGPERGAELFPNGTGQDAVSTRVDAGVFVAPPLYLPAFVPTQFDVPHFCKTGSGPLWTTPSSKLDTAPQIFVKESSPLVFQSDAQVLNAGQRFYFLYGDATQSEDFTPPYVTSVITSAHSSWFGYAWKTLYPKSRLVISHRRGLVHGGPHDALIFDGGRVVLDTIRYLRDEMQVDAPVDHPYDDGLAAKFSDGRQLTPLLTGSGEFTSTDAALLSLSYARENSRAYFVVSPDYVGLPWLGGTLGPNPAYAVTAFDTDSDGIVKLQIPPQAIPPGISLHVQAWIRDSNGPTGFTASNTVRVDG